MIPRSMCILLTHSRLRAVHRDEINVDENDSFAQQSNPLDDPHQIELGGITPRNTTGQDYGYPRRSGESSDVRCTMGGNRSRRPEQRARGRL